MVPALCGAGVGSAAASGEGLGSNFNFFFGCPSGSADGVTEADSSSFRFLGLCSFDGVVAGGVVVAVFREARALEKGVKRFLKAEPISPKRRAASSCSAAALAAGSGGMVGNFSFLDSDRLDDFGLDGTSDFSPGFVSILRVMVVCDLSTLSISMKVVPLACAVALAL